jgi:hypothetical protein
VIEVSRMLGGPWQINAPRLWQRIKKQSQVFFTGGAASRFGACVMIERIEVLGAKLPE